MNLSGLLLQIALLIYIGLTLQFANRDTLRGQISAALQGLWWGLLLGMLFLGFNVLVASDPRAAEAGLPIIDAGLGLGFFALTLVLFALAALVVTTPAARQWVKRVVGQSAGYDPQSPVHTTALVLALALLVWTLAQFVLLGGLTGLEQSLQAQPVTVIDVLFQGALYVIVAFWGVGLGVRRTPADALTRLGLRLPQTIDATAGGLAALGAYGILIIFALVYVNLVPTDVIEQQTSAANQLASSFTTLPAAFVLALSAAVSEEILFRGALQPIFGLLPTSVLFVLLHTQYTLTPVTIAFVAVTLIFAFVRQRYSTTAAIIAHFLYNFVQLAGAI